MQCNNNNGEHPAQCTFKNDDQLAKRLAQCGKRG